MKDLFEFLKPNRGAFVNNYLKCKNMVLFVSQPFVPCLCEEKKNCKLLFIFADNVLELNNPNKGVYSDFVIDHACATPGLNIK